MFLAPGLALPKTATGMMIMMMMMRMMMIMMIMIMIRIMIRILNGNLKVTLLADHIQKK